LNDLKKLFVKYVDHWQAIFHEWCTTMLNLFIFENVQISMFCMKNDHTKICSLPQHYCVHHLHCTILTCDKGMLKFLHDGHSNIFTNSSNDVFFNFLIINFYHLFFNQQICIKKIKGPFTTWTLSNITISQFQMSLIKIKT
jgi:hypothetical protein